MRALLVILGLLAGAGAGLVQRGPVEVAGYRISLRGGAPSLTPIAQTPATPASSRERWAYDLAVALGNPAPSAETVAFIVAWTRAEDGDDAGALARHNPLNTTEDTGAVLVFNSHGVKGYATREDGLAATVRTLGYSYAGYQNIREGIATNDPERALRGLYASPWGTHAALVEQVWRELGAAVTTSPLSLGGPCGHNVSVAAARIGPQVTIPPGGAWSFNGALGDLAGLDYVDCAGVPGGGWCDLAARYAWAAAQLGARVDFQHHGIQLAGVPWEYSVAIWSSGGPGGQDLTITNTTGRTIALTLRDVGGAVTVEGHAL